MRVRMRRFGLSSKVEPDRQRTRGVAFAIGRRAAGSQPRPPAPAFAPSDIGENRTGHFRRTSRAAPVLRRARQRVPHASVGPCVLPMVAETGALTYGLAADSPMLPSAKSERRAFIAGGRGFFRARLLRRSRRDRANHLVVDLDHDTATELKQVWQLGEQRGDRTDDLGNHIASFAAHRRPRMSLNCLNADMRRGPWCPGPCPGSTIVDLTLRPRLRFG